MVKKKENIEEPLEKQLWKAADKLRKNIDAAEYKHVVLGLIFLKYISVSFEELYARLQKEIELGADPEDREEYKAENVFYVPQVARWSNLVSNAKDPKIGKFIDDAMDAIEKENPILKGVLPKVFARPNLDPTSLGELIDLIGNSTLNTATNSADLLGHVFEYFLGEFALAEGKKGGQFYTPRSVVELLVNMLEPYKGRVLDPCCGSGGMFVQSEKFVKEHQGIINDISGGELDEEMYRTVAELNVPYILTHMLGNPQNMQEKAEYRNITKEVIAHLGQRMERLHEMGVCDVILDPGFGFAKTLDHNYDLMAHLQELKVLQAPLLVGVSRKSMVYRLLSCTPQEALAGTVALHTIALLKGASILRVHDVKAAAEAVCIVREMQKHTDDGTHQPKQTI